MADISFYAGVLPLWNHIVELVRTIFAERDFTVFSRNTHSREDDDLWE
jgi:hypothetical protein